MKRLAMTAGALALAVVALVPAAARAHCDSLDGPVVNATRTALDTGKIDPVLPWLQPEGEAEVRAAFAEALKVRQLGPDARKLADRSFFETVVRVHRAGEGAPYTGLKPAGRDLGPAIPAADRAIVQGSAKEVEEILVNAVKHGLAEKFRALHGKKAPPADLVHGRHWVAAYVEYVHYVEGLYEAATKGAAHGHAAAEKGDETHAAGHAAHGH
jgi:hypothetical protein